LSRWRIAVPMVVLVAAFLVYEVPGQILDLG
jgi:hypothetical protein